MIVESQLHYDGATLIALLARIASDFSGFLGQPAPRASERQKSRQLRLGQLDGASKPNPLLEGSGWRMEGERWKQFKPSTIAHLSPSSSGMTTEARALREQSSAPQPNTSSFQTLTLALIASELVSEFLSNLDGIGSEVRGAQALT